MKRNIVFQMNQWKTEENYRRPLFLTGTKGTGKTYLALEFAKQNFPQYLYVNFELNHSAVLFFTEQILAGKNVYEITASFFQMEKEFLYSICVIFDEVIFCPSLLYALLHETESPMILISETEPEQQIEEKLFVCRLSPMSFDEFLCALGNEWYVDIIRGHFANRQPIPDIVHQELLATFEEYLIVGGFPAAVNDYLTNKSVCNIPEIHKAMLCHMMACLSEQYPEEAVRLTQIMSVVPIQLKRENKKFRFSSIRKGVTYQMYRDALFLLKQYGTILILKEYQDENQKTEKERRIKKSSDQGKEEGRGKVYLPDVGLLHSVFCGEEGPELRKALLENYVYQAILVSHKIEASFWESEALAKVEFLLTKNGKSTPVELRLTSSGKSKNIASFLASLPKYEERPEALRFSFENFQVGSGYFQIPFYAVFCL